MISKSVFSRILAIAGTGLVWFPILSPFLFSAGVLLRGGGPHFDYLMPAEFFPVSLLGGGLLLWAALRGRSHRKLIGWSLGLAVGALVASQALAVITGLASGEAEMSGWAWMLVLALIAAYVLAIIVLGIAGVLLLRDLYRPANPAGGHAM